ILAHVHNARSWPPQQTCHVASTSAEGGPRASGSFSCGRDRFVGHRKRVGNGVPAAVTDSRPPGLDLHRRTEVTANPDVATNQNHGHTAGAALGTHRGGSGSAAGA